MTWKQKTFYKTNKSFLLKRYYTLQVKPMDSILTIAALPRPILWLTAIFIKLKDTFFLEQSTSSTLFSPHHLKEFSMPFISVKMLEGRSAEQKRELAQAITTAMVDICGAKPEGTMVVIEEHAREHWAVGGTLVADRQ